MWIVTFALVSSVIAVVAKVDVAQDSGVDGVAATEGVRAV